jgi:hypothetical protein
MRTIEHFVVCLLVLATRNLTIAQTNAAETNSITLYQIQAIESYRTNYIQLDRKIVTYDEALPKLKDRLNSPDARQVLSTVKQLQRYGDSIAGTDVMDRLVSLYYQTPSPGEQDTLKFTEESSLKLDLKGQLLIAIVMSGDSRRNKLLSDARNDPHYVIRAVAEGLVNELKKTDHFKHGNVPVPPPREEGHTTQRGP